MNCLIFYEVTDMTDKVGFIKKQKNRKPKNRMLSTVGNTTQRNPHFSTNCLKRKKTFIKNNRKSQLL